MYISARIQIFHAQLCYHNVILPCNLWLYNYVYFLCFHSTNFPTGCHHGWQQKSTVQKANWCVSVVNEKHGKLPECSRPLGYEQQQFTSLCYQCCWCSVSVNSAGNSVSDGHQFSACHNQDIREISRSNWLCGWHIRHAKWWCIGNKRQNLSWIIPHVKHYAATLIVHVMPDTDSCVIYRQLMAGVVYINTCQPLTTVSVYLLCR